MKSHVKISHGMLWIMSLGTLFYFFQAILLKVGLVKIVRVQWFQKKINCSFMIFISKEILCTPQKPIFNIIAFFPFYLTFEKSVHL